MSFPSIYEAETTRKLIERIEQLTPETQPQWGTMDVAQMLAHLCVAYDITYGVTPAKYNAFMRFMLKNFLKNVVVGPKPYKKNSRTAPAFLISDERDFEHEKQRLIDYIRRAESDGRDFYEGLVSSSFGKMTADEWSVLYYKHNDHHLTQFGV